MKRGQIQSSITRNRVLRIIRESSGISRIDIARSLSMDRSTITHVINDLLNRGLIAEETEAAPKRSGRKPVGLALNGNYGCVLGMEIQPGFSRAILMDIAGNILKQEIADSEASTPDYVVEEYLESCDFSDAPPLLGLSLALPGTADPYKGILIESLALGLKDYELPREIDSRPLLADNDANCFARTLLHDRRYRSVRNMICLWGESHRYGQSGLTSRDDIGVGLILNGTVYYGSHCLAGEPAGAPFYHHSLAQLCREEEPSYLSALFESLENTLYLLDPEVLHIGGELASLAREEKQLNNKLPPGCRSVFGMGAPYDAARGAALLFLDQLYTPAPPGIERNQLERIRWENLPASNKKGD